MEPSLKPSDKRFAIALSGLLALWFQTVAITIAPTFAAAHLSGSDGLAFQICTADAADTEGHEHHAPLSCFHCLGTSCSSAHGTKPSFDIGFSNRPSTKAVFAHLDQPQTPLQFGSTHHPRAPPTTS